MTWKTPLEDALYDRLTTGTSVTSLLSSPTALYRDIAPQGTQMPYLVYRHQGGGDENATPARTVDTLYQVRAVAEDAGTAQAIANAVDALLHHQRASFAVTGWSTSWIAQETPIELVETDPASGLTYFHRGAIYRIRLDNT